MKKKTMRAIFKTMTRFFKVKCGNLCIYEMIQTSLAWKKTLKISLSIEMDMAYLLVGTDLQFKPIDRAQRAKKLMSEANSEGNFS